MIYGCRLGFYLMICEMKSVSYQSTTKNEIKDGSNMKFILKVVVWNSCALLYCCEVSPDAFRLENDAKTNIISIIMTIGILLESADDLTKNYFEKKKEDKYTRSSIHGVKGESYEAVLVYIKSRTGNTLTPKLLMEGELGQELMRLAYVAMTRPKRLLMLAMPDTEGIKDCDRFSEELWSYENI